MARRPPKLGQHLLVDERVVERILGYAELRGDETVLEVGPGRGVLTRRLAQRAKRVVAIEKDPEMVDALEDEGLPPNVELMLGDVLREDWPRFDKCVSNLPYRISSEFTFKLFEHDFELAVLTYQREFAERMVARVGSEDYGRLSVNVSVEAEVETLETIPARAFWPPPKVAGMVVRLRPRAAPPFPMPDEVLFHEVVRAAFQHRRKTLRNALLDQWQSFASSREALLEALPKLPHLERRAEALSPSEFQEVAAALAALRPKTGARARRG